LNHGACGCAGEAALGHAEAMFEIADAVTQCKFEASDKDTDEVVLYKILQVRMARIHTLESR
jgi:predicted small metal-binding protein